MPIDPIGTSSVSLPSVGRSPGAAADPAESSGFGNTLHDLLGQVEGSAAEANQAVGRMLDGSGDVHEAMIALQRADTMLQLTVQVRNKLVQAYQEIMRMPV